MPKTSSSKTTQVNGGTVKRDEHSGRFIDVRTESSTAKASPKSSSALSEAASRRGEVLKRLADR
jgi:hypothetical protein